jgi:beta-glucosidase
MPPRAFAQIEPHVVYDNDSAAVQSWFAQHRAYVDRARAGGIRLLFIGDSLTYGWHVDGSKSWDTAFRPLDAEAFGIGGDETVDVLWRIRHGELDGIQPHVVILSIGTNDLGRARGVAATAGGIAACVRAIRAKLPKTTIIVLGILPRGEGDASTPVRHAIAAVNARIAKLAGAHTRYLDVGGAFLTPTGSVQPALFRLDLLHLSSSGYRVWSATLRPRIVTLLSSSS